MSRGRLPFVAMAILALAARLFGEPDRKGPPRANTQAPEILPYTRAYLLDGRPFPLVEPFDAKFPEPKRTLYVSASGSQGDGSQIHPWNDLQAALRELRPGDRLRVQRGDYSGTFSIDDSCSEGTADAPIQVFFEKAALKPATDLPALTVGRAFWDLNGLSVSLENRNGPGLAIASHDIIIDKALIRNGRGHGVRVAPGASRVTIGRTTISKTGIAQPGSDSLAIEIAPRTKEIRIVDCRFYQNPAGSVRVEAAKGEPEATDITLEGNSIHDDGGPAVALLGGERIKIANNTIFYGKQSATSHAIVLESASGVEVSGNHIADAAVAVRIGFADAKGGPFLRSHDVTIARNAIETTFPKGTAIDIEASRGVRVANNVIEGYDDGIMVFGSPPQTEAASVANNLVLSVSDVAFVLADAKSASYFDHNFFSPRSESVDVQIGNKTVSLAKFLKEGTMPNTKVVKGVAFQNRDLARVSGVATVDRGRAIDGIAFKGSAPDIGVAEK